VPRPEPELRELDPLARELDPERRELDPLARELLLREAVLRELDRDLPLPEVERLDELERLLVVLRVRRRRVVARCARGTSARTTSFTRRANSASRNLAIRSSSRLIDFASCTVSRSPTASANVSIRE